MSTGLVFLHPLYSVMCVVYVLNGKVAQEKEVYRWREFRRPAANELPVVAVGRVPPCR